MLTSDGNLLIGNDDKVIVVFNIVDETNIVLVGKSPEGISKPEGVIANPFIDEYFIIIFNEK